jgi:hypothetical protein
MASDSAMRSTADTGWRDMLSGAPDLVASEGAGYGTDPELVRGCLAGSPERSTSWCSSINARCIGCATASCEVIKMRLSCRKWYSFWRTADRVFSCSFVALDLVVPHRHQPLPQPGERETPFDRTARRGQCIGFPRVGSSGAPATRRRPVALEAASRGGPAHLPSATTQGNRGDRRQYRRCRQSKCFSRHG